MSREKEEYEVGIPLDDLSSPVPPPDQDNPVPKGLDPSGTEETGSVSGLAEQENAGLPSLFDEEELAEIGLKASPFGDNDDDETAAGKPDSPPDSRDDQDMLNDLPEVPPDDAPLDDGGLVDDGDSFISGRSNGIVPPVEDASDTDADARLSSVSPIDGDAVDLAHQLAAIQARLEQIQNEFVGKLKYDAHKDQIIDKLHQELQEYKQDIVKKHTLSIVLDVVKIADDIRKWITYFRSLDVSQRDPVKLFRYLEAIPTDLEDIFYWHGVKRYCSPEDVFNPNTQRAIKKIPTDDAAKDKTVAKRIRPGYEWEGKVIRQEMVAVYVYQDDKEIVDTGNIDE